VGRREQCQVVDRCVQFCGGYGYMMQYPISEMCAAARAQKICAGTSEIIRNSSGDPL
jgi:acyl-CoA dehydrogenase